MRKKAICRMGLWLVAVLAASPVAYAVNRTLIQSMIGPSRVSSVDATIAAAGAGKANCITDLDAISRSSWTLTVLDGATTIYYLRMNANQGLVRSWEEDMGLCGSNNTAMYINVIQTVADAYDINYRGYVK